MEVALIVNTWKIMMTSKDTCTYSKPCLFDLKRDPGERHDLYGKENVTSPMMHDKVLQALGHIKSSAWFGLLPKPNWEVMRRHYHTKMCFARAHEDMHAVPWADSADESYFLKGHSKE